MNHTLFSQPPYAVTALRPVATAAFLLCCSLTAQAQTADQDTAHQLQSVEVTATGLGLGVHEMAAPVSVLDGEA